MTAEQPAEPEIILVTGPPPYGERFGSGHLMDQEVMMSRRRRDAWHEYQAALLEDVKATLVDDVERQARLASQQQRSDSDR